MKFYVLISFFFMQFFMVGISYSEQKQTSSLIEEISSSAAIVDNRHIQHLIKAGGDAYVYTALKPPPRATEQNSREGKSWQEIGIIGESENEPRLYPYLEVQGYQKAVDYRFFYGKNNITYNTNRRTLYFFKVRYSIASDDLERSDVPADAPYAIIAGGNAAHETVLAGVDLQRNGGDPFDILTIHDINMQPFGLWWRNDKLIFASIFTGFAEKKEQNVRDYRIRILALDEEGRQPKSLVEFTLPNDLGVSPKGEMWRKSALTVTNDGRVLYLGSAGLYQIESDISRELISRGTFQSQLPYSQLFSPEDYERFVDWEAWGLYDIHHNGDIIYILHGYPESVPKAVGNGYKLKWNTQIVTFSEVNRALERYVPGNVEMTDIMLVEDNRVYWYDSYDDESGVRRTHPIQSFALDAPSDMLVLE